MNQQDRDALIDANSSLGRRFFAAQDELLGGPAPELCTPDYKAWLGGNPALDRVGHEGFAKGFYAAFPDMRHHIEQVIANDTQVAVRFVLRGKQTGNFFGIPATGKSVTVCAHVLMRISGGKVSELWGIFDEAGLLRQLGVLPAG